MTRAEFYSYIDRERLSAEIGRNTTPCYLYFLPMIRRKHEELKNTLPDGFSIHYAVKANPNPSILGIMADLGIGADVASAGELGAALERGIPPEKIEFSGPGKTRAELTAAVKAGIGSINAESVDELGIIAAIAGELGIRTSVGIRINPTAKSGGAGMKMAGDTQFGIPEEDALDAVAFIGSRPGMLRFSGIHVHAGSQLLKAGAIVANFTVILDLALKIEREGRVGIEKLNFGGGWGIGYFPKHGRLDTAAVASGLAELFARPQYARLIDRTGMIIEPGRFLVGESGVYATRVLYYKRCRSKEFAVVDGGMHHHYLLAGGMGQIIRQNFEMDILPAGERKPREPYRLDVAGCLCTPQDLLAAGYEYDREVAAGDCVVFFNSGTYGPSASPAAFLSHERAGEIVVE